jgi:PAS domain S-box-containing protein
MVAKENDGRANKSEPFQQSDEMFRLLVENVKDYAIFLLDPSGIVSSWNSGAERIKGYRAKEIIGKHFSCFYPREAIETKWPDRELEIAIKEGRYTDEGLRVRKDGSTFWAHVVISALRNNDGSLRGFSKVTRDLTERRNLEEKTRELNKELRNRVAQLIETQRLVELRTLELQKLSGQLMQVQDDERRRLSRTLHDELGQELAALKITISGASVEDEENLLPALEMIDRAISKVRNISYLLHPPLLDESGLVPALHWYFEGLRRRGHLRITFTPTPIAFPRLPGDIETAIFRVVQESLTNVYRHSGSEDARIDIDQQDDRVTVRVRDFGKGMGSAVPLMGVGVSGMKERIRQLNGELKISNAEPGTLVHASVPLFDAGPTRVWSSN